MASELKTDLQIQPPGFNEEEAEKGIATLNITNRSAKTRNLPVGWTPIGEGGENN